jgi:hypothetical protein
MNNQNSFQIEGVRNELSWLRGEVRRDPTHWALSRIAELEGLLAQWQEEVAWSETRKILQILQGS